MSDMQFDNNQNEFGRPPEQQSGTDITGMIVKWGLASDRTQAQYVLIGATVVILIVAYFIYHSAGGAGVQPLPVN